MKQRSTTDPGEPPPAVEDDLVLRCRALQHRISSRLLAVERGGDPDSGFTLFGEGLAAINSRLVALERATHRAVHNLQPNVAFDPLRRERSLNEHTRARKIGGNMITPTSNQLSLVASCHPDTWVAPVHMQGLAIDERIALFAGPPSRTGQPTAWLCSDPQLVTDFCGIWEDTQRRAVPIYDVPGVVRLTERQLDIAALLAIGTKDATIARVLDVSLRTVTNDISRLLDSFGASSRWEAGMVLGHYCPPSMAGPNGHEHVAERFRRRNPAALERGVSAV